ncbi:transcriptional regulator GutM [Jiella sp. MQZ9-1]|uniref:Transcriptional regulator GutM n=1 Tax=Jiella flava TaxID=2816857 RepID=A0A939FWW1_9HYPH|nr:transcriptional regulator GutM [Jiella flava]MBO0662349.1 transcriptional regulator GutM [Jiella flava]MCD2470822.1 transcriptional regulator GutM [Jiella flava]
MELWQIAVIFLIGAWLLQSVGTWFQMRHFRDVMGAVSDKWSDGRVGAGNARGSLGKGVIALAVVDPSEILRKVMVMEGRSVLAKFQPLPEWEGKPLSALRAAVADSHFDKGRGKALANAIAQLDRVQQRQAHTSMQPAPSAA